MFLVIFGFLVFHSFTYYAPHENRIFTKSKGSGSETHLHGSGESACVRIIANTTCHLLVAFNLKKKLILIIKSEILYITVIFLLRYYNIIYTYFNIRIKYCNYYNCDIFSYKKREPHIIYLVFYLCRISQNQHSSNYRF